jgi:hypothetical protein
MTVTSSLDSTDQLGSNSTRLHPFLQKASVQIIKDDVNSFFLHLGDMFHEFDGPSITKPNLGCSVAQLVVRWLAVRQARVRNSARHPMENPFTEPPIVKIWRWVWRWASSNV